MRLPLFNLLLRWLPLLGVVMTVQAERGYAQAAQGGQVQPGPFQRGARICFVGNSITFNGGFLHDIALFHATRYPADRVSVINCGIGGNMAANVLARMDSDILARRPDWCVLMLGMNDVHKELYTRAAAADPGIAGKRAAALAVYRRDYERIVQIFLAHHIRVILQMPTIYDETAAIAAESLKGRNGALRRCADFVKGLGEKYYLPVVDYWNMLQQLTRRVQVSDSTRTLIGADRVHPGPVGHFIMAYTFLRKMGVRATVSGVRLAPGGAGGAAAGRAGRQGPASAWKASCDNATVTDIRINRGGGSWRCLEGALPFPVGSDMASALELVPFQRALNRELLTVERLEAGSYDLLIDGAKVGTYTAAALAQGIDLAGNVSTPAHRQAREVLRLFREYWQLEGTVRWIEALTIGRVGAAQMHVPDVMEDYFAAHLKDTADAGYRGMAVLRDQFMAARRQEPAARRRMEALMDSIYFVNRPVAHRYELVRVADAAAIAASQGAASPLYFEPGEGGPLVAPIPSFDDPRELVMRDGLPHFFHKIAAGGPLTVAFIGGSVTQMDNKYRNQAARGIQDLFPHAAIRFLNAGVSGTGTDLGACRIHDQVLRHHPDLIFIEFAVNGAYTPGLEGMIRQIWRYDTATDICLLYAIYHGQTQYYQRGVPPVNVLGMDSVAAWYGLPAIHLGLEPSLLEAQGKLVFQGTTALKGDTPVFSDGIHPTEWGGYLYASAIVRSLRKLQAARKGGDAIREEARRPLGASSSDLLPAPLIADNWEDAQMLSPNAVQFGQGWTRMDLRTDSNLRKFASWFPFVMRADSAGVRCYFDFTGTCVGLFDIGGPEAGQLDVVVDGRPLQSMNRFNHWCNNRYRGQYDLINLPAGRHHVEFIVSKDIPDKAAILGKAQSADITAHPWKYDRHVIYLGKVLIRGNIVH